MKKLLLVMGVLASSMAFSQSHTKGMMQFGLGWQSTLGGADFTIEETYKSGYGSGIDGTSASYDFSGIGVRSGLGLRFNYGLADNFSAGAYLRTQKAVYAGAGLFVGLGIAVEGFSGGLEARYYLVNKDKFNFYLCPQVGFTTGKLYATYAGINGTKYSGSGITYGVTGGISYFFTDLIGLTFDLGYAGGTLTSKYDESESGQTTSYKVTVKNGGVTWGLNLAFKFGGN